MDKKLANLRPNRILWLDLEMTGLSPNDDLILEVAAIVTDWNFKEIASYEGIVKNEDLVLSERLSLNAIFWDANPASRDGLMAQNQHGKPLAQIEEELMAFIAEHFEADK